MVAEVACILLEGDKTVDEIAADLWGHPDRWPDTWCSAIRVHVSHLRKALLGTGWTVGCCTPGEEAVYRLLSTSGEPRLVDDAIERVVSGAVFRRVSKAGGSPEEAAWSAKQAALFAWETGDHQEAITRFTAGW